MPTQPVFAKYRMSRSMPTRKQVTMSIAALVDAQVVVGASWEELRHRRLAGQQWWPWSMKLRPKPTATIWGFSTPASMISVMAWRAHHLPAHFMISCLYERELIPTIMWGALGSILT